MNIDLDLNSTEQKLVNDSSWPTEVVGSLEIIDGGDVLESGFTSWLSCVLTLSDSDDDLSVMLKEDVLKDAAINEGDFDDENLYRLWITSPEQQADLLIFQTSKIRKE